MGLIRLIVLFFFSPLLIISDSGNSQVFIPHSFYQRIYLMDLQLPAPSAAYSLRKLSRSYNGPAIKVRRSSDNTEQDIYFNIIGDLDTASLMTFVGAGTGFVTVWYDQVLSNNATQATAANQAQIVTTGTLEAMYGKPVVNCPASRVCTYNLVTELNATNSTFVSVVCSSSSGASSVLGIASGTQTDGKVSAYRANQWNNTNKIGFTIYGVSDYTSGHAQPTTNLFSVAWSKISTSTTVNVYRNGAASTLTVDAVGRRLGLRNLGDTGGSFTFLKTTEYLFYSTDLSASQALSLHNHQKNYFGF